MQVIDDKAIERQIVYRMLRSCQMKAWDTVSLLIPTELHATAQQSPTERRIWAIKNRLKDIFKEASHTIYDRLQNSTDPYTTILQSFEQEVLNPSSKFQQDLDTTIALAFPDTNSQALLKKAITSFNFIITRGRDEYIAYRDRVKASMLEGK